MSEIQEKIMAALVAAWPKSLSASQLKEIEGVSQKRAVALLPQMKGAGLVSDIPHGYYFTWRLTEKEAAHRGCDMSKPAPSRTDRLCDRAAYIHIDTPPARNGASDAFQLLSKRQDGYHAHRAPLALTCQKS